MDNNTLKSCTEKEEFSYQQNNNITEVCAVFWEGRGGGMLKRIRNTMPQLYAAHLIPGVG